MENLNERDTSEWVDEQLHLLEPAADWQPNSARALAEMLHRDRFSKSRRRKWMLTFAAIAVVPILLVAFSPIRARLQKAWSGVQTAQAGRDSVSNFSIENIAGGRMGTQDFKGKVAVVDLWATWCEPCLQEIPKYNELHDTYRGKDVAIVGIAVESPRDDILSKVKTFGIKYSVLVGNDESIAAFGGLFGFPTTFVVDKDGKIYKGYQGVIRNKHEQIRHDIETLLAENHRPN